MDDIIDLIGKGIGCLVLGIFYLAILFFVVQVIKFTLYF